MNHVDYSFINRLLHHISLGNPLVTKLSFELESELFSKNKFEFNPCLVFVTGLARGGTTVLMEAIYQTNEFVSLTYKNMPFVLAPNIWKRINRGHAVQPLKERSHGDGILVNAGSPEAFDEVFWKTFCGKSYIFPDKLIPHGVPAGDIQNFKKYIHLVLLSAGPGNTKRYLSKNNNNILRLQPLAQSFPQSVILIPFRDPLQHAGSLLNQQLRFVKIQSQNPFALKYMNWLGHYEFGLGQKPFIFEPGNLEELATYKINTINYWLIIWKNYYAYLLQHLPANGYLIQYEKLCEQPLAVMPKLNEILGVDLVLKENYFVSKNNWKENTFDHSLLDKCREIYNVLIEKAV